MNAVTRMKYKDDRGWARTLLLALTLALLSAPVLPATPAQQSTPAAASDRVLFTNVHVFAELLSRAGKRHPYQEGPLGVIKPGAYADLIIVDGNSLEDISLLADPETNLKMIMKDGRIYKNALQ